MNPTTRQQTLFEQCSSLVEKMKNLGLMSVKPQHAVQSPSEIAAAKLGVSPEEFGRMQYAKRCERASALGMTTRQYQITRPKKNLTKKQP